MRKSAALGLAAILLAPAGCADAERKTADMASAPASLIAQAQDCDLRVGVQPGPGSLLIGYEFRNRSDKTAFLFNVLHRTGPSGGPETGSNLVYIYQSSGSITLAKKIFPVPPDVDVEKPDVPYVTRVEPGQVFRERFTLPLPLKPWAPYRGYPAPTMSEAAVFFELGFFLAPDPSVAKQAGGNLIVYPFPTEKQTVLRAGPLGRFPLSKETQ